MRSRNYELVYYKDRAWSGYLRTRILRLGEISGQGAGGLISAVKQRYEVAMSAHCHKLCTCSDANMDVARI